MSDTKNQMDQLFSSLDSSNLVDLKKQRVLIAKHNDPLEVVRMGLDKVAGYFRIYNTETGSNIRETQFNPDMSAFCNDKNDNKKTRYPIAIQLPNETLLPREISAKVTKSTEIFFIAQNAENGYSFHPEFGLFPNQELYNLPKTQRIRKKCTVEVFTYNPSLSIKGAKITLLGKKFEDLSNPKSCSEDLKSLHDLENTRNRPSSQNNESAKDLKVSQDNEKSETLKWHTFECFCNVNNGYENSPSPMIINGLNPQKTEYFFTVVTLENRKSLVNFHLLLPAPENIYLCELTSKFNQQYYTEKVTLRILFDMLTTHQNSSQYHQNSFLAEPLEYIKEMLAFSTATSLQQKDNVRSKSAGNFDELTSHINQGSSRDRFISVPQLALSGVTTRLNIRPALQSIQEQKKKSEAASLSSALSDNSNRSLHSDRSDHSDHITPKRPLPAPPINFKVSEATEKPMVSAISVKHGASVEAVKPETSGISVKPETSAVSVKPEIPAKIQEKLDQIDKFYKGLPEELANRQLASVILSAIPRTKKSNDKNFSSLSQKASVLIETKPIIKGNA